MENDLKNALIEEEKKKVETLFRKLDTDLKLHKLKTEKYYDLKRKARLAAKKECFEAFSLILEKTNVFLMSAPTTSTTKHSCRCTVSMRAP